MRSCPSRTCLSCSSRYAVVWTSFGGRGALRNLPNSHCPTVARIPPQIRFSQLFGSRLLCSDNAILRCRPVLQVGLAVAAVGPCVCHLRERRLARILRVHYTGRIRGVLFSSNVLVLVWLPLRINLHQLVIYHVDLGSQYPNLLHVLSNRLLYFENAARHFCLMCSIYCCPCDKGIHGGRQRRQAGLDACDAGAHHGKVRRHRADGDQRPQRNAGPLSQLYPP